MKRKPTLPEIRLHYNKGRSVYSLSKALRKQGYKFSKAWMTGQVQKLKDAREAQRISAIDATVNRMMDGYRQDKLEGTIESADRRRGKTNAKTLLFTSAQSNTKVHAAFLATLESFCRHRDAELHIAQFTYNKATHGASSVKPGSKKATDTQKLWYDEAIAPYVSNGSIQLTRDLVWCGELNILPTMKNPLTQFQTYTRQDSAIIPHAKMMMQSVPTMKEMPPKFLYTTGCVTQRNYIQKTSGQVADFHHVFGAMLVEIDDDGTWWARQINATNDGSFYDLHEYFTPDGRVEQLQRVEALTHGDIHYQKRDPDVLAAVFGPDGVVDALSPKLQFIHDLIDFTPRNHHNIKDPHFWHQMHVEGSSKVEEEFMGAGKFLTEWVDRIDSNTYVITSNHDQAIEQWLRDTSSLFDPPNVMFWHHMNLYCHIMREHGFVPRPFGYAVLRSVGHAAIKRLTVLHEDESFLICDSIEAGLHGHLGPNGARGNPKNLRTVGKANTAHTHSAGIFEGVYTAGVYGKLDMGYNKGLSGWSHSMIVTYKNAKRAILTIKKGRAWR